MQKTIFSLLISLFILSSCQNSASEKKSDSTSNKNNDSIIDKDTLEKNQTVIKVQNDTLPKNEELISVQDWKTDDFIIQVKDKKSESVRRLIENEKEEWKNVKNPFIATYKGCDFGDYFHITFEDANGKVYDFGFGKNNFGEYILYNGEQYEDNPKYLNKKFKVYWNWKITTFHCCDGEYDPVEAYLPSITNLELIETK